MDARSTIAPVVPSRGTLRPVAVTDVAITGGFWADRQRLNRETIIPHCEYWMDRLGWITNFDRAAADSISDGHRGREFADSEIYKLLEAMSWETGRMPSEQLRERFAALVDRLTAAQEPDGYLHTLFGHIGQRPRYSDFVWGHELYCFGHLIQAAVARTRTAGDDGLLRVARRLADHVCAVFGPDGLNQVCGHAEIETALVELYRLTGHRPYLDQAALFVNRRGRGTLPQIEFGRHYYQDDIPVREARTLRGHAVRALYLSAGAVDVAVETGDDELLQALITQWHDVVAKRTYLTGGMGSHHMDEAFGEDHVLPPDRSYCETCAGVASIMFSWRLLLATGAPEYADLIERTLFNIIATSPAWDGKSFFYANTLHQRSPGTSAPMNEDGVCIRGASSRREQWFEVSCCPPNLARTLASLGGYLATTDEHGLQLHQFADSQIRTSLPEGRRIGVDVTAALPGNGEVRIKIVETDADPWRISVRVPSWATGATLTDGASTRNVSPGTATVTRQFQPGDELVLRLPVVPRFTAPAAQIDAVRGCVAVERGPEVLCLESVDLPDPESFGELRVDLTVPPRESDGAVFVSATTIKTDAAPWPYRELPEPPLTRAAYEVPLIPYHDWANRGASAMRIWIPTVCCAHRMA